MSDAALLLGVGLIGREPMNRTRTLASIVALSLASLACAQQDGTFPPPGGPGGPGGQEGQRPPRDPAQMIERMMQNDANGDGKLAKDELPAQLADRMFDRADANKDGFIDKAELEAFAKAGGMRGGGQGGQGGQGGPGGQRGGGAASLEGAMKQMNGAYKALNASALDASTKAADLEAVQRLQMAVFGSKGGVAALRMSDAAKAKYGDDRAAFEAAFRRKMLETAKTSMELEIAILEGKTGEAKALVKKLHEAEESGHDVFKSEEGGEGGEAREGRGQGRGQGGGGQGGGQGGGRGSRQPRND